MGGNIHLKHSLKALWKKILLMGAVLFIFEFLFALTAKSARIKADMVRDLDNMPPMVEKMFGQGFAEVVLKYGIVTFGYLHPFIFIPFIVVMFMSISQMLTSDVGSGAIGFLLSRQLSRRRIFANMGIVIWSGTAILAASVFLASYLGIVFFLDTPIAVASFVNLSWNLFLIMLLISGYTVVFAAISDSGKKLFTYAGVAILFFYLAALAAPLWRPLEVLNPINPFYYYQPIPLLMGQRIAFGTAMTLMVASGALYGIAAQLFSRRDISSG